MKKTIFVFSALMICLLLLFQLGKYAFLSGGTSFEIIVSAIAMVFLFVGLYINKRREKRQNDPPNIDVRAIKRLGISDREYQVLIEVAHGLSNKEIGEKLHVSESTVKTHVSNLLIKLDAKRRTQAIQIAKELSLIAP